jgi:hypothetical protein
MLVCINKSFASVHCQYYTGQYSTVSESEFNYILNLEDDCTFTFTYSEHVWQKNHEQKTLEIVEYNEKKVGTWQYSNNQIIIYYDENNKDVFSYNHLVNKYPLTNKVYYLVGTVQTALKEKTREELMLYKNIVP